MESLFYVPLLGSTRLFVSAPTPALLVLVVVSFTPLIPLSSTQPSCPSRRLKCWLSSLVSSCGPKNCVDFSTNWQSKQRTCHQDRSLTCSLCSIMCARTLVLCFPLWFWALHIRGHQNTIADSLSRWDTDPQFEHTFYEAAHLHYSTLTEYICTFYLFALTASGNHLFLLSYFRLPSMRFAASCSSNSRLLFTRSYQAELPRRLDHLP